MVCQPVRRIHGGLIESDSQSMRGIKTPEQKSPRRKAACFPDVETAAFFVGLVRKTESAQNEE